MKKQLLALYCTIICSAQIFAAETITITLQNQYNAKAAQLSVSLQGNMVGKTNEDGAITITANPSDSIYIEGKNYSKQAFAISSIPTNKVITIKKDFSWKDLLTPMFYIINGGLWFLLFVVFAETGLFAGFFLPGDSLLFVAGIYNQELIATIFPFVQNDYIQLLILWLLISAAGILGNAAGYWFGRKVGPSMYNWKENILFKKKYLEQAHEFYEKHGGGAIIIARFLPIIRTFAPIVAGIVGMDKKKFTYFNIVGCIAWVFSMLAAGHFLQKWILSQFGFDLKTHLELIVLGIVFITTAPVLIKLFTGKKKQ